MEEGPKRSSFRAGGNSFLSKAGLGRAHCTTVFQGRRERVTTKGKCEAERNRSKKPESPSVSLFFLSPEVLRAQWVPTQEMRKQEVVAGEKKVVVVRGGRRRRRQKAIETNVPSFPFLTGRKVFFTTKGRERGMRRR